MSVVLTRIITYFVMFIGILYAVMSFAPLFFKETYICKKKDKD